jgi:hypothetical protein
MSLFKISVMALLLASCMWKAFAQDATGKITGTITDPSGAVMANVKVTAISAATNKTFQTRYSSCQLDCTV